MIAARHRMRSAATYAAVLVGLLAASCRTFPLGGNTVFARSGNRVSLSQARLRVSYNLRRGMFGVTRVHNSIRLAQMATAVKIGARQYASTDPGCVNTLKVHNGLRMIVESAAEDGPTWETRFEICLHPDEGDAQLDRILRESYCVVVSCRTVGHVTVDSPVEFSLIGQVKAPRSAFACRMDATTSAGSLEDPPANAATPTRDSVCDSKSKCAVRLRATDVGVGIPQTAFRAKRFPLQMRFSSEAGVDFVEDLGQIPAARSLVATPRTGR